MFSWSARRDNCALIPNTPASPTTLLNREASERSVRNLPRWGKEGCRREEREKGTTHHVRAAQGEAIIQRAAQKHTDSSISPTTITQSLITSVLHILYI